MILCVELLLWLLPVLLLLRLDELLLDRLRVDEAVELSLCV